MLKTCRWCSQTENGYEAIKKHESIFHPKQYYSWYLSQIEEEIAQLIQEAKELREKYAIDSSGQE